MRLLPALVIGGVLGLAAQPGQRAELQLAGGSAAALPRGPIILVPWDYREDCRPVPWNPDRTWQPPQTAAFYTGQLRPRDQWLGGVPTKEFFTLYEGLPTEDVLKGDRRTILAQLSAWAAKHPGLTQREPARTILANLRRAVTMVAPESTRFGAEAFRVWRESKT